MTQLECPVCGEVCRCDLELDLAIGKQQTWWQRQTNEYAGEDDDLGGTKPSDPDDGVDE